MGKLFHLRYTLIELFSLDYIIIYVVGFIDIFEILTNVGNFLLFIFFIYFSFIFFFFVNFQLYDRMAVFSTLCESKFPLERFLRFAVFLCCLSSRIN